MADLYLYAQETLVGSRPLLRLTTDPTASERPAACLARFSTSKVRELEALVHWELRSYVAGRDVFAIDQSIAIQCIDAMLERIEGQGGTAVLTPSGDLCMHPVAHGWEFTLARRKVAHLLAREQDAILLAHDIGSTDVSLRLLRADALSPWTEDALVRAARPKAIWLASVLTRVWNPCDELIRACLAQIPRRRLPERGDRWLRERATIEAAFDELEWSCHVWIDGHLRIRERKAVMP